MRCIQARRASECARVATSQAKTHSLARLACKNGTALLGRTSRAGGLRNCINAASDSIILGHTAMEPCNTPRTAQRNPTQTQ